MSQSFLAYCHKILDVFLNVQFSNNFILSIAKSLKMLKETWKIIVLYFSTYIIERKKYKGKLPQIFLQLEDGTLCIFCMFL